MPVTAVSGSFPLPEASRGTRGLTGSSAAAIKAAAVSLGMTVEEVRAELEKGQTLAGLARARGRPVAVLEESVRQALQNQDRSLSDARSGNLAHRLVGGDRTLTGVPVVLPRPV